MKEQTKQLKKIGFDIKVTDTSVAIDKEWSNGDHPVIKHTITITHMGVDVLTTPYNRGIGTSAYLKDAFPPAHGWPEPLEVIADMKQRKAQHIDMQDEVTDILIQHIDRLYKNWRMANVVPRGGDRDEWVAKKKKAAEPLFKLVDYIQRHLTKEYGPHARSSEAERRQWLKRQTKPDLIVKLKQLVRHIPTRIAQIDEHIADAEEKIRAFDTRMDAATTLASSPEMIGKLTQEIEVADVLYCILSDISVADYGEFEDWANDFGYGPDSRKAHGIWTTCTEMGVKFNAVVPATATEAAREILEDF